MTERTPLRNELLRLMQESQPQLSDAAFNDLALRIFRFQFEHNLPYRKYCERRGVYPHSVRDWVNVPAVPTAAFKEAALVSGDASDAAAVFRTSGTTHGEEKRGAHYVLDLELYEHSLLPTFRRYVLAGLDHVPIVSIVLPSELNPESSLSFMVSTVLRQLGTAGSTYAIGQNGIDFSILHKWLRAQTGALCILGTSLAFVHWFEHLARTDESFVLPAGSRVMDTGGFKGSTRVITSTELRAQYTATLGIGERHAINEYGMTEMLSQFYDAHALDPNSMHVKQGPAWVRSVIVDPETLAPLPPGELGLLKHFDLANLFSVSAIQTEDLAINKGNGFELLGRAGGAAPRGCSIAMDMFLSAARE
jgi:hypothetical protein